MGKSPLISVVIPTYNEANYLSALLSSIKKQTYHNYEIIVADYKSDDGTKKIVKKYGAKLLRLKESGIANGRNAGFYHAHGEIIVFIDADYELPKNLFSAAVREISKDEKIAAVWPVCSINTKEIPKSDQKYWYFNTVAKIINNVVRFSFKYSGVIFAFGCVFVKRSAIDKVGEFNGDIAVSEDIEFYSRIKKAGRVVPLEIPVKMSCRRYLKYGIWKSFFTYIRTLPHALILKRDSHVLIPVRDKF